MFLRCKTRHKDGKSHRYWSVVESRRVRGGRIIQRHVLYLGEINDGQEAAWRRSIAVFADGAAEPRQMALFPEGRALPVADSEMVQIRLGALALRRPRQWGGCWLAAVDIGVAMGARGAAASAEAADVVLLVDHLDRLLPGIEVAQRSRRIAIESVVAGIGLSVLGMIAAAFGYLTPVQGALLQELIDVAVILNALRALRIVPGQTGQIVSGHADATSGRPPRPTSTAA